MYRYPPMVLIVDPYVCPILATVYYKRIVRWLGLSIGIPGVPVYNHRVGRLYNSRDGPETLKIMTLYNIHYKKPNNSVQIKLFNLSHPMVFIYLHQISCLTHRRTSSTIKQGLQKWPNLLLNWLALIHLTQR